MIDKVGQAKTPQLEKLDKACKGIEGMFLKDLLAAMRRSVPKREEEGFGGQIYKDMFDDALAQSMSKSGSLGIAKVLFRELSKAVTAGADPQIAAPKTDSVKDKQP